MVKDQQTDEVAARHAEIYDITNEVLNSISITSSLIVISTIIYLRIKHKNISNRVSLRLQTYVSIADILFSSFQIMTVNSSPPGNWVCNVAPWGFVFTALLGCFLTVTIAFNLQIIFIYNYINTKRFEKFYIIVPFLLSLTLSVVPVIFDALGFDEKEVSCWYKHGNTASAIAWQWTTLHGWIVLSVLYCSYSVFRIIRRLRETSKSFIDTAQSVSNPNRLSALSQIRSYKRQIMINQAVKRIVLYPLVPIISFTFNISAGFVFYIAKRNFFEVSMLSNIGTSSQGLFNAIMFCFDPAMRKVWDEVHENLPKMFKKYDDSNLENSNSNISLPRINSNANVIAINVNSNNNDNNGETDENEGQMDPTGSGTTVCEDDIPPNYIPDTSLPGGKTSGIDPEKGEEVVDEEGDNVIALL